MAAQQVVAHQGRSRRHGCQRDDPRADGLDFRGRNEICRDFRQRIRDEPATRFRVRGSLYGAHERDQSASIRHCANHVHDRVNQAPGKVAAKGGDEHLPDLLAPALRHRHGARKREHHEQAEEHFRHPVHWIEHRVASCLVEIDLFIHGYSPIRPGLARLAVLVFSFPCYRILSRQGCDRWFPYPFATRSPRACCILSSGRRTGLAISTNFGGGQSLKQRTLDNFIMEGGEP
jgi:hypothetical protein